MITEASPLSANLSVQERIAYRAFAQMVAMIHLANHRKSKQAGDPKVGGHPASCASSLHIQSALHLEVAEPQDFFAHKPHASPVDHALGNLLHLFRHNKKVDWFEGTDGQAWFTEEEAKKAMTQLRAFPTHEHPHTFQSYHAASDPDNFHYLPTGTVGIPPVSLAYVALAYRYAKDHGYQVPERAHFWALIGDSEFREGSLFEAMPEVAERELGNVTWIVDYNRQNLDGTRAVNEQGLARHDCDRIEGTAVANGWRVIQVRHGKHREAIFAQGHEGAALRQVLETGLSDYEFQMLLLARKPAEVRAMWIEKNAGCAPLVKSMDDETVLRTLLDVGGHCWETLCNALRSSREDEREPVMVVVHTLKGWGLESLADPANHSTLPKEDEVEAILARAGLSLEDPFAPFPADSPEGAFCKERGELFRDGQDQQRALIEVNQALLKDALHATGPLRGDLGINTSMMRMAHTQWAWGQLAAKLVRLSGADGSDKPLSEEELAWAPAAQLALTMSPDVGSSTNISSAMNTRVYGPAGNDSSLETKLGIEYKHPAMVAHEAANTRHIRFEIAEANVMCAVGAFGKMGDYTGVPLFPIMTVYDFFLKRALDQLYYSAYWGGSFCMIGTPSGVSLSSEGAQHSWKSDIQMPGLITWEPSFACEVDWILSDAMRRHVQGQTSGRNAVLIRGTTRELPQALLLDWVRRQARSKQTPPEGLLVPQAAPADWLAGIDESTLAPQDDAALLERLRADCLAGAYKLIDWEGYAGYEPGDNVLNVFVMGALVPEACTAVEALLARGIFANLIVVSSPELLLGILGEQSDYDHLRHGLGVHGDLYATAEAGEQTAGLVSIAGRRVPVVAVLDGEAGLLDNIGSIVGVKQRTLAVRKYSKCGRPSDVYRYHHLDPDSIVEAAGQALSETALENLRVAPSLLRNLQGEASQALPDWRTLWPR
ncbi:MAG: pyruvate dehydrogenase [Planctomycetes bacterium]|nr:pyruvate dehydrogenase [Planctomycetota bacterium]